MTAHWFDPVSFKRKSACLALRRVQGQAIGEKLAGMMHAVHDRFGIVDRVRATGTDHGSNLGKAFRLYSTDPRTNRRVVDLDISFSIEVDPESDYDQESDLEELVDRGEVQLLDLEETLNAEPSIKLPSQIT